MRAIVFAILVFGIISVSGNAAFAQSEVKAQVNIQGKTTLTLSSPAFKNNEMIPKKYTCDGQNISPQLKITNIPKKTKSLALILDDPGAPKGTFNHWVIWHISPKKTQISEGEKGKVSEGLNGIGQKGYFGPCPPSGTHKYTFKLYALNSDVDISEKSKSKDLRAAIANHIIQTATLVGKYSKAG